MIAAGHLLAAVLASWRLTELMVQDRLTAGLRARWPLYLWTCSRCVSVWAGLVVTVLYVWYPWGNWPFAFAWLYLVQVDWVLARRQARWPKQILIAVDEQRHVNVQRSDFPPEATVAALRTFSNGVVAPTEVVR